MALSVNESDIWLGNPLKGSLEFSIDIQEFVYTEIVEGCYQSRPIYAHTGLFNSLFPIIWATERAMRSSGRVNTFLPG